MAIRSAPALHGAISRISHTDGLQGADRVEVTVSNERLQWLDHPLLQVDNPFTLSLGYAPDPKERVFVGEITGVNASFPQGGMPALTVVAHDFLQRLTTGTKDRGFMLNLPTVGHFPLPDPLVTSLVAATNLLVPLNDPVGAALSFFTLLMAYAISPLDAKKGVRLQEAQSDFDFLTSIAKDNGWEMYIDHNLEPQGYVLRFQFLVQDYSPSVSLKWGESLAEFTPKLTTVGQVLGVQARIWIAAIKMEIVVVLSWDYDRAAFDLQIFPGFGGLDGVVGPAKARSLLKVDAVGPATMPKKLLSELLPRAQRSTDGLWERGRQPRHQGRPGHRPARPRRPVQRSLPHYVGDTHHRQRRVQDRVRRGGRKSGSARYPSPRPWADWPA